MHGWLQPHGEHFHHRVPQRLPRDLQRMIQAHFERCPLVKPEIAVGEEARESAGSSPDSGSNSRAFAPAGASTSHCTQSCADGYGLNHVAVAHSLALDFAFGIRRFDTVFAGDSGDSSDERHFAVAGIDFVETEQQARVDTRLNRAHVADDRSSPRYCGSVRSDHVFGKLSFEMLARLQLGGLEPVVEANQEGRAFRNGPRRRRRSLILCQNW